MVSTGPSTRTEETRCSHVGELAGRPQRGRVVALEPAVRDQRTRTQLADAGAAIQPRLGAQARVGGDAVEVRAVPVAEQLPAQPGHLDEVEGLVGGPQPRGDQKSAYRGSASATTAESEPDALICGYRIAPGT